METCTTCYTFPIRAGRAELEAAYLREFYDRAGPDWDHTVLDSKESLHSSDKKVHVLVQFTRCNKDGGQSPLSGLSGP
jgi:hypothetical protein